MPDKPCYYDVLGLQRDASDEEIKRVYRRLALFWHPDKNTPDQREDSADVFRLITEAYSVLGDPKQREKYDREGHKAPKADSAGATAAAAAAAAAASGMASATAPHAPTPTPSAPTPTPSQHMPQGPHDGWGGGGSDFGGGWNGMPVGSDYGQGWQPQPQQPQPYPFQQAPSPFMQQHQFQQGAFPQQQQHQHQFQQPNPFPQQQENPYAYGDQFATQGIPFEQHQAPQSWGSYYNQPSVDGYGTLAPPSLPQPSVLSQPTSTELALPEASPPAGSAAYPGGFPHTDDASHSIVAHPGGGEYMHQHAPSHGMAMVAHPGVAHPAVGAGFPQQQAPSYDLPPIAVAPPSTYPPSSESEESESEESEKDLAVVPRDETPSPVRTVAKARSRSIFRRGPKKEPYPTETRYVPPQPERLSCNYYPKERGQSSSHQYAKDDSSAGLVLKLHLGTKSSERKGPPSSVGPLTTRPSLRRSASTSSGGRSEGGMGGIIQEMDRMFSNVMGGGMFGAGLSLGVAGEENSDRGLSGSFRSGGGSSRSGGFGGASMMSSHTVVDGRSRTLFSRTERTVIDADGTRETKVQEFQADTSGGSASSRAGSRGGSSSAGDVGSRRSVGTSKRGSLRSFFGK